MLGSVKSREILAELGDHGLADLEGYTHLAGGHGDTG